MSKTQRFFRILWRINAILILVAAAGMSFAVISLLVSQLGWGSARRQAVEAAPDMGASQTGERLFLGQVAVVPGTTVMRGELQLYRSGSGFSSGSGGYREVRNLLFIEEGASVGRWLLPDNDHIIVERLDVSPRAEDESRRIPVATVALVKAAGPDLAVAEGELLLLRPPGQGVQTIADAVRELHTAAVQGNDLLLLFERQRRYVRAVFDIESLGKRDEHEVEVPQLR